MNEKKKDFYYSAEQERILIQRARHTNRYVNSAFKGKRYTECKDHGEAAPTAYGDAVLVGTGFFSDCTYTMYTT
ncbi:MAG: hypothetical protein K6L60_05390 [Oceanobacter sp.]